MSYAHNQRRKIIRRFKRQFEKRWYIEFKAYVLGLVEARLVDASTITIRRVTADDIIDLFKWRNHPRVRKNFFNRHTVEWEAHESWFKTKSRDPNTYLYIACSGSRKIGYIRFDCEKDKASVSVALDPIFFGKRLATSIITLGVERFIKEKGLDQTILAEIKNDNIASIKAFQKAGFESKSGSDERVLSSSCYVYPMEVPLT